MIEVRPVTKKEAKISGTEIKSDCAWTLALSLCNNDLLPVFVFGRSSILSDVSSSASRKLPSNKSIVLLGSFSVSFLPSFIFYFCF